MLQLRQADVVLALLRRDRCGIANMALIKAASPATKPERIPGKFERFESE